MAATISLLLSAVNLESKSAKPTISSDKYHKCKPNFLLVAAKTSECECCRSWIMSVKLLRGASTTFGDVIHALRWITTAKAANFFMLCSSFFGHFKLLTKHSDYDGINYLGHPSRTMQGTWCFKANFTPRSFSQKHNCQFKKLVVIISWLGWLQMNSSKLKDFFSNWPHHTFNRQIRGSHLKGLLVYKWPSNFKSFKNQNSLHLSYH